MSGFVASQCEKKKKKNISNVEGDVLKFEMVFQSVTGVGEKREMNVEMLVAWLFPHEECVCAH